MNQDTATEGGMGNTRALFSPLTKIHIYSQITPSAWHGQWPTTSS